MAVLQTVRYPIHAIQTIASSHVSRLFVISPTIAMLLATIGRLFENFLILDRRHVSITRESRHFTNIKNKFTKSTFLQHRLYLYKM